MRDILAERAIRKKPYVKYTFLDSDVCTCTLVLELLQGFQGTPHGLNILDFELYRQNMEKSRSFFHVYSHNITLGGFISIL